jgi:hypothetical protein
VNEDHKLAGGSNGLSDDSRQQGQPPVEETIERGWTRQRHKACKGTALALSLTDDERVLRRGDAADDVRRRELLQLQGAGEARSEYGRRTTRLHVGVEKTRSEVKS